MLSRGSTGPPPRRSGGRARAAAGGTDSCPKRPSSARVRACARVRASEAARHGRPRPYAAHAPAPALPPPPPPQGRRPILRRRRRPIRFAARHDSRACGVSVPLAVALVGVLGPLRARPAPTLRSRAARPPTVLIAPDTRAHLRRRTGGDLRGPPDAEEEQVRRSRDPCKRRSLAPTPTSSAALYLPVRVRADLGGGAACRGET